MKAKTYMMLFLCGGMAFAGTGCTSENTPENKTAQTRHLTITMTDAAGAPIQRMPNATITDEGTTLLGKWTAGDIVGYCNLSRTNGSSEEIITGSLAAASTGVRTDLNGDVTCTAGDYLAIVYPAADMSESNTMGDGVHGKFTISLAGQDGSLSTLATHYHYVYGRAHVDAVTGTTATATMNKMESLLTVCKFSFVDKKAPDVALPIHTLTISYGGSGSDAGKYPQTATVEVTNMMTNEEAQAVGVSGSEALTINAGGATELYVALLPTTASRTYNFIVTNANGSYNGTAEALLKKGEYVIAANLKLAAN